MSDERAELRAIVNDKLTGIHAEIRASNEIGDQRHKQILKAFESLKMNQQEIQRKQDITNGRITRVESETRPLRYIFYKKPMIGILVTISVIYSIYQSIDMSQLEKIVMFLSRIF